MSTLSSQVLLSSSQPQRSHGRLPPPVFTARLPSNRLALDSYVWGICGKGLAHRGWWGRVTPRRRKGKFIFLIFPVVQNMSCEVSKTLSLEDDPSRTFNWTSKAEKCNPGEFCQETVLLIKAGKAERMVGVAAGSSPQSSCPVWSPGLTPCLPCQLHSAFPSHFH